MRVMKSEIGVLKGEMGAIVTTPSLALKLYHPKDSNNCGLTLLLGT
jgi:hypothetical protein